MTDFVLTGSQQLSLIAGMTQSLAGNEALPPRIVFGGDGMARVWGEPGL